MSFIAVVSFIYSFCSISVSPVLVLYFDGATPYFFLNDEEKCTMLLKPQAAAISVMLMRVSSSILAAVRSLTVRIYLAGDSPVAEVMRL